MNVVFMDEALAFVRSLDVEARQKITYNYKKVERGIRDDKLFKKLQGSDIWELRTLCKGKLYRLFSFWDNEQDALIVVSHGIVKKSQKTPLKEIKKAEVAKRRYFEQKHGTEVNKANEGANE